MRSTGLHACSVLIREYRIKWKPPGENSVDFKLELRFSASPTAAHEADLRQKPLFLLMENCGNQRGHEFFDVMDVDDEEWEQCVITSSA